MPHRAVNHDAARNENGHGAVQLQMLEFPNHSSDIGDALQPARTHAMRAKVRDHPDRKGQDQAKEDCQHPGPVGHQPAPGHQARRQHGQLRASTVQQAREPRNDDAHQEQDDQPAHYQQHHGVNRSAYELVLKRLHFPLMGRIPGQSLAEVAGALAGFHRGDQQPRESACRLHGC